MLEANSGHKPRLTNGMEKAAVEAGTLQLTHGAGVAVRKNRLWSVRAVPGLIKCIGYTLNGL